MKISVFWFRRDLRLEDNAGLAAAMNAVNPVLPLYIFDNDLIEDLNDDDPRISFIYDRLLFLNKQLLKKGSSLCVMKGRPEDVLRRLIVSNDIISVYVNKDYDPYSINQDLAIKRLLAANGVLFYSYKDHVIFGGEEVLKPDSKPYTVFTPYRNRWMHCFNQLDPDSLEVTSLHNENFLCSQLKFPPMEELGFRRSNIRVQSYDLSVIPEYHQYRDLPSAGKTSHLSPHLRYGTVSIRSIVRLAAAENQVFLNELIWREFFMQILYHFPHVVTENFKSSYNEFQWRNDTNEFMKWCRGETGYPIVDAGMRQLNETGYMHNRVRMIVAGFLCKNLLIDWRWGEAYFAEKLIDYELSSNNGNWQWAGGTGCDAAAYYRIFNPESQQKRFDPGFEYIRKWVPELNTADYPAKIVDFNESRERAIETYNAAGRKRIIR